MSANGDQLLPVGLSRLRDIRHRAEEMVTINRVRQYWPAILFALIVVGIPLGWCIVAVGWSMSTYHYTFREMDWNGDGWVTPSER